ncbi:4-hydroxy-tetrahydrodipicolinate synthase [Bradyrhizobium sp. USDA 4524]|uniref:dihydrodipicolinate synthase family protein n=1 Tax=unclassified Bradyrhizobium TaxID=2631580 RepID=UPI00209D5D8B|nr:MULTISPECIES: dihydrodipicolinate synthase family protein [unclassified Bradyrhizobium]MCP1844724.1 4-hydroxy-tetrahydrodipicolinate synthase [Bradyrhizobium sp. USDA 4538]MCP1905289.1 4-hydroxy-tetrahydrodipicolinate synthase [Bradyrhizobium sp. USDA 4537]MCP1989055.1 4-hydroxy-tetrahydrodipicolinate synthase [Bradyrhizobium sp. USDA 4539]
MISLKGLSAFPITPSNRDGRVDVGALRALLDPLIAAKVDSVGLLGSTGSYPYFSRDERRRAVQAATALADGNTPILVGIGALRTDDAVRLAKDARDAGATAGLLAAVSYTPLTDDEVFEHFQTVARESGLAICIYDNPGTTHFQFTPALIGRLSRVEGIVAVKSPALDASTVAGHLGELRAVVPDGVALGYSADWNCTEALLAGGDTWYSVLAGIFPKVCVDIVRAATSGDAARARQLNGRLQPIWDLFRTYSSLRVVYALADLRGVCTAEPPRPILPLPADAQRRVKETLAAMEID